MKRWSDTDGLHKTECLVCLEPTGHYANQALRTLVKLECFTWLAYPRDIRKSIGLQRGKSDKVAARRIADHARRFGDKAHLFTSQDLELEKVGHPLTRRRQLVKERKRHMVQIKDRDPCLAELRAVRPVRQATGRRPQQGDQASGGSHREGAPQGRGNRTHLRTPSLNARWAWCWPRT